MTARIVDVEYHTLLEGLAGGRRSRQSSVDGGAQVGGGVRVLPPHVPLAHRARARRRAAAPASAAPAVASASTSASLQSALRAISGSGADTYANEAERLTGRLHDTPQVRPHRGHLRARPAPVPGRACRRPAAPSASRSLARYFYYAVVSMNRVRLLHVTEFEYDGPVSESYNEVHLQPARRRGCRAASAFRLRTQPASSPTASPRLLRQLGAPLQRPAEAPPPARRGRVGRDDAGAAGRPAAGATRSPRSTRQRADAARRALRLPRRRRRTCRARRRLAPLLRAAEDASGGQRGAASRAPRPRSSTTASATSKGATHVHSSVADVLATGAGVCQDFAHLLLALARMRGIPGALRVRLPVPRGADAGHATDSRR